MKRKKIGTLAKTKESINIYKLNCGSLLHFPRKEFTMLKLRIDGRSYQLPTPPEVPLLQIIQEQLLSRNSSPPQAGIPQEI
jgi:hypothetical protein